jgi:hypothetical protein
MVIVTNLEEKMKKTILAFLLMGTSLCAFAQNGVIKQVNGQVELKRAGETAYAPAQAGDTVSGNTVISTGFRSFAVIEVGGASIQVRPATRLTLTEIRSLDSEESLQMNLRSGSVRVDVAPPAGKRASATVQSPSATASVRGTSFYFDTRNLRVTQGTVLFNGNRGYTIQVNAGSGTAVGWDGTASAPQYTAGYRDINPVGWDSSAGTTGGMGIVFGSGGPGSVDVGVEY